MEALCDIDPHHQPYTLFEIDANTANEKTPLLPLVCQMTVSKPRSGKAVTRIDTDPDTQPTGENVSGLTWKFLFIDLAFRAFWLITPMSFLYTGLILYKVATSKPITVFAALSAICSFAEVSFAIYQRYLIWNTRRYTTTSVLTHSNRADVMHALLHGDLRSTLTVALSSGSLEVTINAEMDDDSDESSELDADHDKLAKRQIATVIEIDDDASQTAALDFQQRHRKWFMDARWKDLHQDDILTWLGSKLSSLPLDQILACPHHAAALWATYAIIEKRSRTIFPPGRSPHIKVSCLTLDPLNAIPRPLILYAISGSANYVIRNYILPSWGFRHHVEEDIEYMLRIPPGWTPESGRIDPKSMPLMYLHGLGFGLIQNIRFLKPMLEQLPTHPILFPLAHHTAQSITHKGYLKPWTRRQFIIDIQAICAKWEFAPESTLPDSKDEGGLSVISHSNGSVRHSWMIKDCPHLIRRHTFVDPIVFCLDEGFTCHAFCYRKPTTPFQLIMQRLVSTELGISFYIQRHFHWSDNFLLVDEHPNLLDPGKTKYFLGKKDDIVDAVRVREYLESHGVIVGKNLKWDDEGGHSKALLGESLGEVLAFAGGHIV